MIEEIQKILKQLPEEPGIYKMLNSDNQIIYIGKSKCLKKRVKSYFVPNPKWEKVKKMLPFISALEYEVTDTHLEAMLLECELIKKIKPYFNVMMKNDQRYVYLNLESSHSGKPLTIVYQREENSFGPFRRRHNIQDMIDLMLHFYPISKLRKNYLFEYHFFPEKMDKDSYNKNRNALSDLLTIPDETAFFLKAAEKKMKAASRSFQFETALAYKNLIDQLSYLSRVIHSYEDWMDKMVFADIAVKSGHKLFFISNGFVVHKSMVEIVTDELKINFIQQGKEKAKNMTNPVDDKGRIDYRDIIFSELTDGMIELINE